LSLPQFTLLRPRTLQEAVGALAKHVSNIRVLAGGTDLIPSMRQKLFEPEYVLDIRHLAELKGVHRQSGEGVSIGALSTLTSIEHSEFLRKHYPVLTEAAATVASPVLRNMGTIGGNICLDTRCLWYNQSLTWRFLHQERWRLMPCCSRRNQVLGGILWRHSSGAALPECRDRDG